MYKKKWLIFDCNFLCHRLKHTLGILEFGGKPTGVIYGFLKTISAFQKQFNTPHIVFCWDSRTSKRSEFFPEYKMNRISKYKDMDNETIAFEREFRRQMQFLRRKYLPTIGYKNVFVQPGYEADDLMASITMNLSMSHSAVVITSDKDLYQLIRPYVSIYNPTKGKLITQRVFDKKYNIIPGAWGVVKAIAGCSTDGVPGVQGVGEKTAIRYLNKTLNKTTKAYQRIVAKEGTKIYNRNIPLVVLPFSGTKCFRLRDDEISEKGWEKVVNHLGMKSLKDKAPIFKPREGSKK